MPPLFEVRSPGSLSTIQDRGRPDATSLGVPRSGACDPWSLAVANLLLGNDPGAAALEVTLVGPELDVLAPCTVALAGAELGARDVVEDRALAAGGSYRLRAGTTLAFGGGPGAGTGVRTYLAVAGGFDVPEILGSRSTCLAGSFGGLDGRPLRAGDRLSSVGRSDDPIPGLRWPGPPATGDPPPAIRVLPGPHAATLPRVVLDRLVSIPWVVSPASDRMGLRLDGPAPDDGRGDAAGSDGSIVSIPVTWGAVQLPPGGQPIVLLADHQTVGGYPVVACVCSADLPRVGQLAPGDELRFAWTTPAEARDAYRQQHQALLDGAAALRRGDPWDRLADATQG